MPLLNPSFCGLWNSCCSYLTPHNTKSCIFSNQTISLPNILSWGHLYRRMGAKQTASFPPIFAIQGSYGIRDPSSLHSLCLSTTCDQFGYCVKGFTHHPDYLHSWSTYPPLDFGQRNVSRHDMTKGLESTCSSAPLLS